MQDGPLEPVLARPLGYAQLPPEAPRRFPFVPMTPAAAIVDMVVITTAMVGFAVCTNVFDLHTTLENLFPVGGMYVWVLLNGLLALGTMTVILKLRNQSPAAIGLNKVRLGPLLLGIMAAVPACYFVAAVCSFTTISLQGENLMQVAQERTSFLAVISDIPLNLVVPVVLFVGFYEEMLFRGFLLPRLMALIPGQLAPVFVCAAIFGLVHFPQGLPFMAQTAGVGAVLAFVVLRSDSLWPAILTHAAIDGISLLIAIKLLPVMTKFLEAATSAPTTMP